MIITKRNGNGQTECYRCKQKGKFALTWDCCLYNYDNKPYCYNCLMEELEKLYNENKHLKKQNEFLMKQDNILQTLIQWLYKEQERYRKTLSERPTNDKEYINAQVTSVALEQINVVIDKIKELKEELK